jgi:hypothetical protein
VLELLLAPIVGLMVASAQPPPGVRLDILDTGIVFTGRVEFDRGRSTTTFTVADPDSLVMLQMSTERAFSKEPNSSTTYEWAETLARARTLSIRVADIRGMPIGTMVRSDSFEKVMACMLPTPTKRTAAHVVYELGCIATDKPRRLLNDAGDVVLEIVMTLSVSNHSPADLFLGKPREHGIYVRLEPGE